MKSLEKLQKFLTDQAKECNRDRDSYMHGFLNGMIHSRAIIEGKSPEYAIKKIKQTKPTKVCEKKK